MTLEEEIQWWTRHAYRESNEAWMLAFGVATGLKIARADYAARDKRSKQHDQSRTLRRGAAGQRNARR